MPVVEVSLQTGAAIVALAGVLGGLWGGMLSVRAAVRGPEWVLKHLKRVYPVAMALVAAGIAVMILVSPRWVGVGLIYVTGIVAWMARRVSRTLERVRATGTFEPLPADRQAAILLRASRWLLIGGAVIAAVAVVDYLWRGWPAVFDLLLAAVMLIPGFRIRKQAAGLVAEDRDQGFRSGA